MQQTRIDFLRHGDPEGEDCFRGSGVDHRLGKKGLSQMKSKLPRKNCWDQVITSPLLRCHEFAEQYASKHELQLTVEPRLVEIGFGVWEGRTKFDIETNDAEAYKHFKADPVRNRPAGAEPLEKFSNRVWHCYEEIHQNHRGKRNLIVTHAGVLRVIISRIMGLPLNDVYNQVQVEYAAMLSTRVNDKGRSRLILPGAD